MLKFVSLSLILSLFVSAESVAADACSSLFTTAAKAKPALESTTNKSSIWKSDLAVLTEMSQTYRVQVAKGVHLRDIVLTNNKLVRETLDWMSVRSERSKFISDQFVLELNRMKSSEQISYIEFLRLSHEFVYRIEGRTDIRFPDYFTDVADAPALRSFLLLPTQLHLTAVHLNEMLAESIMPLGMVDSKVMADGREMSPSAFFRHDLGHAQLAISARAEFDSEKIRNTYWTFKSKIDQFSKRDQEIYENIWFLLTHELPNPGYSSKEIIQALKVFKNSDDPEKFDYFHYLLLKNSDVQEIPKDEFRAYVERLENLLDQ